MRKIIPMLALLLAGPAAAQSFSGIATAVDGDTLRMAGERVRLFGIDAPESMQTCDRGGTPWACGKDATTLLAMIIEGKEVACVARDRDAYGRIVATCRAGPSDLSGVMVREGLAVTLPQFTTDYIDLEARAKQFKLALWGSTFAAPSEFRRANPGLFETAPRPVVARASAPQRVATASTSAWSYRNCAQARAAGAAPMRRGQPGYGAHMDGDGDGVACETPRR